MGGVLLAAHGDWRHGMLTNHMLHGLFSFVTWTDPFSAPYLNYSICEFYWKRAQALSSSLVLCRSQAGPISWLCLTVPNHLYILAWRRRKAQILYHDHNERVQIPIFGGADEMILMLPCSLPIAVRGSINTSAVKAGARRKAWWYRVVGLPGLSAGLLCFGGVPLHVKCMNPTTTTRASTIDSPGFSLLSDL